MIGRSKAQLLTGCSVVRLVDTVRGTEVFMVLDREMREVWTGTKRWALREWLVPRGALELYNNALADWNDADADAAKVRSGQASRFCSLRSFLRDPSHDGPTWHV